MAAPLQHDTLTPIFSAQLGPQRTLGGCVMDYLCDHRLSQVSHVFRQANQQSMCATVRRLAGRDPQDLARMMREFPDESESLARVARNLTGINLRIASIFREELVGPLPAEKAAKLYSYLVDMGSLSRNAARLQVERHLEALEEQGLDLTQPAQVSRCLAKLHQRQKLEAAALGESAVQPFNEAIQIANATPLSLHERFVLVQHALLNPDVGRALDTGLRTLWTGIRASLNAGPPANARAREIRVWMNDPAHAESLSAIQEITFRMAIVPPEIGKLSGLTKINIHSQALGLPVEMRAIPNLQTLSCRQTLFEEFPPVIRDLQHLTQLAIAGRFHELPEWLDELPELQYFYVSAPVRALSDELWQRFKRREGVLEMIDDMMSGNAAGWDQMRTLGIPRQDLTDIPFTLWFKENIYIPYLPLGSALVYLLEPLLTWIKTCHRAANSLQALIPFWILLGGPGFLFGGIVIAIHCSLNLPAFLVNLFLNYAAEPCLTALRDALGYSRTVQIRD